MVAALAVRWQTSRASSFVSRASLGLRHQRQRLRDALIRNQAQKRRLLQLRRKPLPQRAVKNRIAGSVGEVGQNDRVFFGELRRTTMQEEVDRRPLPRSRSARCSGNPGQSLYAASRTAAGNFVDSLSRFSRCRSVRISAALWYRRSRSFSSALSIIRSNSAGMSGFSRTAGVGVPSRIALKITAELSPRNGKHARRHLVQDRAEGKQIAARVQFLGARLLRRHVGDRAHGRSRTGQMRLRCCPSPDGVAALYFRQAEIQNLGVAAIGDENVGRLDIAVNDAFGMRGVQRIGNLNRDRKQLSNSSGLPPMRSFSVAPSRHSMTM